MRDRRGFARIAKAQPALVLLLVMIGTGIAYWPGMEAPFRLDDEAYIRPTQGTNLHWPEVSRAVFSGTLLGGLGRSLSLLSFVATSHWQGTEPAAYRLVNLWLHLAIGGLLFGYLRQVLRARDWPQAETVACFGAALWLAHPLFVTTVLYPAQRQAQLPVFFMLLGLTLYAFLRERGRTRPLSSYALLFPGFALTFLAGVLSKENGALLGLLLLLTEALFFRFRADSRQERWLNRSFILVFGVCPYLLAAGYLAFYWPTLVGYQSRDFTLEQRLLTEARVLWYYLRLILVPDIRELSLFHDDFPLSTHWDAGVLLAVAGWLALGLGAVLARRRWPLFSFGVGWFLIGHALESTIMPLELVFEHRNYLSAMGPLVWIAGVLAPRRPAHRLLARVAMTLSVGLLLSLLFLQAQVWGDDSRFVRAALAYHPQSPRTHNYLANYLIAQRDVAGAQAALRRMTELEPDESGAFVHLLLTHCARRAKVPEAFYGEVEQALRAGRVSSYTTGMFLRLIDLLEPGRCAAVDAGRLDALLHLAFASRRGGKFDNRMLLKHRYALFLWQTGRRDLAEAYFAELSKVLGRLRPVTLAPIAQTLFLHALQTGRLDEAERVRQAVVQVDQRKLHSMQDLLRWFESFDRRPDTPEK